jgi:heparan-alpha-glucosaminide N-acetyltransferase
MSWIEWTDNFFRGLDLTELNVDQAYLNVSNARNAPFYLYSLSEECVKCPFRKVEKISALKNTIVKLSSARNLELRLFSKDHGQYVHSNVVKDGLLWSHQPYIGEFGVYDLIIKESNATDFEVAKDPVSTFSCKLI